MPVRFGTEYWRMTLALGHFEQLFSKVSNPEILFALIKHRSSHSVARTSSSALSELVHVASRGIFNVFGEQLSVRRGDIEWIFFALVWRITGMRHSSQTLSFSEKL